MTRIDPERLTRRLVATPTPPTERMTVDTVAVRRLVEHRLRLGVRGLFLSVTCGEGPWMPNPDRRAMVRATGGRRPVDGGNADGAHCGIDFLEYLGQASEQRFVARPVRKGYFDDAAAIDESLRVNGTGLILITRAMGEIVAAGGSIIKIGSIMGLISLEPLNYRGTGMNGWYPDYFFHKGGMLYRIANRTGVPPGEAA